MKKFALLLTAVLLTAISAKVFAQGIDQTVSTSSIRNYWVNSADYATPPTGDAATNVYDWSVYIWNGTDDYTLDATTVNPATPGDDYSGATDVDYNTQISWLKTGNYVVEVVETNGDNCTTIRRFGVVVIDLDLLVVTRDHTGDTLSSAGVYCNTNEGDTWGTSHNDDLNNESLATMTMTYEISLYAHKGSTTFSELIGTTLPDVDWEFEVQDASTIPSGGNVTWTVTGGTGTYTANSLNRIEVAKGNSTVTITAEMQNIAADTTNSYELDFSIIPSSVFVLNSTTAGDFEVGTENDAYDGVIDPGSHTNYTHTITVNPIPNTTKIKFD